VKSKSIKEYLAEKRANGVKDSSIKTIQWVLESMDKIKPLDKCKENDLKRIITKLDVNEKTMSLYKIYLKNYFRWRGEPEKVAWVRIKKVKTPIHEDSLLTPDEIKKLLDACQNPRDSSLIAILSESACRISEALNLNIGDLSKTDYGFKMRIRDGKTGARDIALISSVPHLTQWLNMHPLKSDTNAPLFVSIGSRNHYERMAGHAVRKILRAIKKRAGIEKRVHPHLFRHTTLTNLAGDGMQESILRKLAGWTGSSDMPAVYIHVGNKDVEQTQLAYHGKAVAQRHLSQSPLTKECPNCHKEMPIEAQYCDNCSKHQELTPVVKRLLEENLENQRRITELERKGDEILKMVLAQGKEDSVKS
jgi:integrase